MQSRYVRFCRRFSIFLHIYLSFLLNIGSKKNEMNKKLLFFVRLQPRRKILRDRSFYKMTIVTTLRKKKNLFLRIHNPFHGQIICLDTLCIRGNLSYNKFLRFKSPKTDLRPRIFTANSTTPYLITIDHPSRIQNSLLHCRSLG